MGLIWKAIAAAVVGFSFCVQAQPIPNDYPKGGVTLVVGFPAGGGADAIARYVALKLNERWQVPVVVENRPGAGGVLSASHVARAAPDGSVILLGGTNLVQLSATMQQLPFDVLRTFTPAVQLARVGTMFIAPKTIPVNSLEELAVLAKNEPGRHSFASYGAGTSSQMFGELFNQHAGTDLLHVPFKGAGQAINEGVLAKQVSVAVVDAGSGMPFVTSGQVKVLAVTGTERLSKLPEVPHTRELGIRSMDVYGWYGLFIPIATPDAIARKINADMREIISTADYRQKMESMGLLQPAPLSVAQFREVFSTDKAYWDGVISKTGVGNTK
jgi:tripartite-type tricarboxylate transporter receptor subunit TctC